MGFGGLAGLAGLGGASETTLPPATQRTIEVDGTALPEEVDELVESVVVLDRLRMPSSFSLVIRDFKRKVLADAGLQIGAKVRISATYPGGQSPEPLIYGEITSVEAEYDVLGMRAVVRGYDLLHRLTAGRKTKEFKNATYADVVEEIAKAAGLDVDTDATGAAHNHLLQANLSDLDFLHELARKVSFDVRIDEQKLLFKEAGDAADAPGAADAESAKPTQLVWSDNLLEFRGRVSAVSQVKEVNVRGWDVTGKQAVIGKAQAATRSASVKLKPDTLASTAKGEALVVVDRPVGDQGGADDLARAIAAQVASAAFEATATAVGSPLLRAGAAVSISDVDPSLAGDYVISSARHEFGAAAPYRTQLEFSGHQDRSIHGLLANGFGPGAGRTTIPGVMVALVSDNKDPDNLGRVRLKFPWLADDVLSNWTRVATIGAGRRLGGGGHGIAWIPEPEEEVLVAFMHGDVNAPVVVGSLWNGVDKPPELVDAAVDQRSGEVAQVGLISRNGHGLIFNDSKDADGIVLSTATGPTIDLDDKAKTILLECEGREIKLSTTGNLVLKAGGNVTIEAGGTLEMTSKASMTIKGATVAIN